VWTLSNGQCLNALNIFSASGAILDFNLIMASNALLISSHSSRSDAIKSNQEPKFSLRNAVLFGV